MSSNSLPNSIIAKCQSWADFVQSVSSLSKAGKGKVFERLTQLYLQTKPEYQTSLKEVWLLADIPVGVRRKLPNLPKSDEGIDLVAETRSGEFWAFQCKYKSDKDTALTVRELTTFTNLAFNSCGGHFARALVVHSTNKPVRKHKLLGNTTEIGLQRWLELSKEEWRLFHAKLANKPVRPKQRSPRPHQQKAIADAAEHFLKHKKTRGKLLMPCGTGKSLTAFWIAQSLHSRITLVVVPSLSLLKQSVEDWTREQVAQNPSSLPEWLCVCSDQSVGNVTKDEFVESVYDIGLPVTTDLQEVREFLGRKTQGQRIVFVTYQSSPIFAKAARLAKARIDFAVFDEAHKTAGEKSKAFSTLLFDENIRIQRRMFMTATERVAKSGSSDEVVSMDDPDIYGECIHRLSFKNAIHAKPSIISDYKILTVFVTQREIKKAILEQSFISDAGFGLEAVDARQVAAAIALRKSYREFGIKHAVSFHRSIRAASDFADLQCRLNGLRSLKPKIDCFHISSKKSAGERTELLTEFAGSQRSLITNAKCLTEGVDVPAIDCVLFADPKQSTIDIVQAAGRALRPFSGKDYGYIMLPIIVPDGVGFEEFADSTDFQAIAKVIASLSTQDERIAEEFRVSRESKARRESIIRFSGEVPVGMNVRLDNFAAAVSAKVWERVGRVNWRPFDKAREYARNLDLKSSTEWRAFAKSTECPPDIPFSPDSVYRNSGWLSYGDWLGTGEIATFLRQYRPFEEARSFVRKLKLSFQADWYSFIRNGGLPADVPSNPNVVYRASGWTNMGDWLGTGRIADQLRKYRCFEDARKFARGLNLTSQKEWFAFAKTKRRPVDIPANPRSTYANKGWISMGDWLGSHTVAPHLRKYRPFGEAREFARGLRLTNQKQWFAFTKTGHLPIDIPANPNQTYKDHGWNGYGDWIGTGEIAPRLRRFRSFVDAREFARNLNLKSKTAWFDFIKSKRLPSDIPTNPSSAYREVGWSGYGDWLGTGTVAMHRREYLAFNSARAYVRKLKLKSEHEWRLFTKSGSLPDGIPATPAKVYNGKGWLSMGDWLGTK
jgi:superfamily II DNA or RNA helicase